MRLTRISHPAHMDTRIAAKICKERGLRFTPRRRQVLEALLACNGPVSAYGLIRMLEHRLGRRINPPTIYRALEFLQEQALVIRIETRNAFLPAHGPGGEHVGAYFLCDSCDMVQKVDLPDLHREVADCARQLGFDVGRRIIELQGTCADCRSTDEEGAR